MIKYVVIIFLMLFNTGVSAHNSSKARCNADLMKAANLNRMEALALVLAEYSSENGHLSFRVPEYRPTADQVLRKVVALQQQLRQIRSLPADQISEALNQFESTLASEHGSIESSISQGKALFRQNSPAEAAQYEQKQRLDRGRQHPDRPMKRETLGFGQIPGMDGLNDWPIDFSVPSTPAPTAQTQPAPEPVYYDDSNPWLRYLRNWPPREKP